MDQVTTTPVEVDEAARIRAIRSRLPGQMLHERIEMASVCYGPLYTWAEIRQKVAETLPRRIGFVRSTTVEPIETYREHIPDKALLQYDDAVRSGFFSKCWWPHPGTTSSDRSIRGSSARSPAPSSTPSSRSGTAEQPPRSQFIEPSDVVAEIAPLDIGVELCRSDNFSESPVEPRGG